MDLREHGEEDAAAIGEACARLGLPRAWVAGRVDVCGGAQGRRMELACRHVAERCGELAGACRAGRLPAGAWCRFWVGWSQEGFAAAPRGRFPDGLWRVWTTLRPHAERLSRRGG